MGGAVMSAPGTTPGPWRVVPYDAGDRSYWAGVPSIQAPEECDCAIVHWDGFKQEYWASARGDKEMLANAHLIAAAPVLYDALEKIVRDWDGEPEDMYDAWVALRLARGEHGEVGQEPPPTPNPRVHHGAMPSPKIKDFP